MPHDAAATVARLLAVASDVQPGEVWLDVETLTLGRSALCDVVVARPVVSRLHARIGRDGPRFLLIDAGSANGTFVNGTGIDSLHALADRDEIGLGDPTPVLRYVDPDPTVVYVPRLRYDEQAMRFSLGGQTVDLSPNEFKLLRLLFQQRGQVCARALCAEAIWGRDYAPGWEADALDRVVSNLRGKLRRVAPTAELVRTRPGLGYELTR